jgi:uncharacterized membrane protein
MGLLPSGWLAFLVFLLLLLLPFFFANAMLVALSALGLSPQTAVLMTILIFLGGLINIPVKRIRRKIPVEKTVPGLFGVDHLRTGIRHQTSQYTIVAVNLGGCVIPCLIVIYELIRLSAYHILALTAAVAAVGINVFACYRLAKPVENLGLTLPSLVPGLLAAISGIFFGILFSQELAPPIAFCSGVLGPLIGGDLFHLKDIYKLKTTVASIGGAGTFDGIVLSGLIAALLAI